MLFYPKRLYALYINFALDLFGQSVQVFLNLLLLPSSFQPSLIFLYPLSSNIIQHVLVSPPKVSLCHLISRCHHFLSYPMWLTSFSHFQQFYILSKLPPQQFLLNCHHLILGQLPINISIHEFCLDYKITKLDGI